MPPDLVGLFVDQDIAARWATRCLFDPADADTVVATTEQGPVGSADGGRTWTRLSGAPPLVVLAWTRSALVGVSVDGSVHRSADSGRSWSRIGSAGGAPEAVTIDVRTGALYVAVAQRGIVVSPDGGRTFTGRYAE